jgi:hypothetical protein
VLYIFNNSLKRPITFYELNNRGRMNFMKCPNCGSENQFEGAAFCRNCHEPLDASPAENKDDSEDKKQGTGLNLQTPPETSRQDPVEDEPRDASPAESGDDSEDKKQGTDSDLQAPPESSWKDSAKDEPPDVPPAESNSDSGDEKQGADLNLQAPPESSWKDSAKDEPPDVTPTEIKDDSEDKKQGTDLNLQAATEMSWKDSAKDEPPEVPRAENKGDSEDKKQSTDLNLQTPPETDRQDPVDDEPLKLSDPIDFMINEIPDESPQEAKDPADDVSEAASGSNPAINREDEFRLSISGGSVGSTVKLEEAINKAIASINISDDNPEEEMKGADPGESSPQGSPEQAPKISDAENEYESSTTDKEDSQEKATDSQEKDSVKPADVTAGIEPEVKETETEPQNQDAAQTAPVDSQDQNPPQGATADASDHDETSEIEADKHVPSKPPMTDMEASEKKPAVEKEDSHEEASPTKKVQATNQWNSVLSIKPRPPAESPADADNLPRVSRSKGVILLSGNNLILTGGRRVVSGDEVRIGDQLYEVKVKPERFSRNNLLMAAGAALLVIIIMMATFLGGGDGRLVGILVDGRANYPLGEQTVRIVELNKSVQTNLAGFFIFDDLSPGLYTLQYMRNGSAVSEVRIAILEGDITTVTLHTDDSSRSISGN